MTIEYLDLADFIHIASAVTGLDVDTVVKVANLDLADSALHAPAAGFGDEDFYPGFLDKAAVLIVRLAKNHPLPDGNKRAAWVALRMFVELNNWTWNPRPTIEDAEAAVMAIAAGDAPRSRKVTCAQHGHGYGPSLAGRVTFTNGTSAGCHERRITAARCLPRDDCEVAEVIQFFPDVGAEHPLWDDEGHLLDLAELPLTDELRRLLEHWSDVAAWPQDLGADDMKHVVELGRELWQRTSQELGVAFDVRWNWSMSP